MLLRLRLPLRHWRVLRLPEQRLLVLLLRLLLLLPLRRLLRLPLWLSLHCPETDPRRCARVQPSLFFFAAHIPCACLRLCVYGCGTQATIAHEVGHVLGFHHPDAEFEINLQATQGQLMGNATCWRALDHVELAPDKDLGDSIMYSMTTSRDRTCLTSDDLEGLNYLYPTCDGTLHPREDTGEPLCIKGKRMGGWVRLAYVVFGPWIIICLIFLLLQCSERLPAAT